MKLRPIHAALLFAFSMMCCSYRAAAQIPTNCFEITSILVDACGSPEGENEIFRFAVGPNPLTVSNLTVTWPSNSFLGWCTDPAKLAALNATIGGCGYLLTPPGGIIPAGAQVIVITSTNMNVTVNSFANLTDTLYLLFQCAGNTNGHFANYSTTGASQARTLTLRDNSSGCSDAVTYMKNLLTNASGGHSAADGAGANFDFAGNITYYNNGCNAPFLAPAINAGNDTTIRFCTTAPIVSLHGSKVGSIRALRWTGGSGTFSQPDSLNTTYTPSPTDVSPLKLYLLGTLCPDTLRDSVIITIIPPVHINQSQTICQGNSYTIGTHTYTTTGVYNDTLLTVGGCDSVVTTNLTMVPYTTVPVVLNGCNSVTYGATAYTASTTFIDTLRGSTGCDSIHYNVSITVRYATGTLQNVAVCAGTNLSVGTHVYNTAGTYRDTVPNSQGCDSVIITILTISTPVVDAGNNTTICRGDSTQLQATGGLIYTWTPTTGLSNPNIANPMAKPTVTTTYRVTSSTANANQIINGNFSSGNTGFSSAYTYTTNNTNEGQYNVGANAQSWNAGMASCGDHTTGTGNMLLVNGATTANVSIYCQTVNVVPNTDYAFSTWLQTLSAGNPAQLQFSINGILLGSVFSANASTCVWEQFFTTWNSGAASSATICIVNQNIIASGNDFAIDDISFSPLCVGVDSVKVTVIAPVTSAQSPTICQGQSVTVGGNTYNTAGIYTDTLIHAAASGCDSIVTTTLNVINPTTGTLALSGACSVTFNGQVYSASTTVLDTLRSQGGCDSIRRTVTITVTPVTTTTINNTVCINTGQSYPAGGQNQTTPGIYNDTLRTALGCDSVYTVTDLRVVTATLTSRQVDSCNRATVGGTVYTADATVSDTIRTSLGCDSIINTANITIHSPYTITLASSQTLPLVEGDSTTLSISPTVTYYNIVWSPDSNIRGINGVSPTVAPQRTTTYSVVATDSLNCRVSGSIEITVIANSQLDFIMPTAFSPNGDGRNDLFKPILRNGAEVTMFHIYNRWGELIYDQFRDNSDGWEGLYKNIAQPIGVYVYFITVKGVAGNTLTQQGNLTLLR